ncbi:hypothetical protein ACNF49_14155 [Actinomadura sp. ATCC 39365]
MLQFTHDGQTIEVDLDGLPLHEGLALQKATGKRMAEFLDALKVADMEAFAALGWVLVKFRCGKSDVTFEDVCEGRVVVLASDFVNPEASTEAGTEGNGDRPKPAAGRAKTRT